MFPSLLTSIIGGSGAALLGAAVWWRCRASRREQRDRAFVKAMDMTAEQWATLDWGEVIERWETCWKSLDRETTGDLVIRGGRVIPKNVAYGTPTSGITRSGSAAPLRFHTHPPSFSSPLPSAQDMASVLVNNRRREQAWEVIVSAAGILVLRCGVEAWTSPRPARVLVGELVSRRLTALEVNTAISVADTLEIYRKHVTIHVPRVFDERLLTKKHAWSRMRRAVRDALAGDAKNRSIMSAASFLRSFELYPSDITVG